MNGTRFRLFLERRTRHAPEIPTVASKSFRKKSDPKLVWNLRILTSEKNTQIHPLT